MVKEIIVDCGLVDTRVALLEDGDLVEIYIERPYPERLVGSIYRGIICDVLPGMQAAFVDIGHEKKAFLHAGNVLRNNGLMEENGEFGGFSDFRIEELLKPGQEITVQVIKEPTGGKGPRVTTQIALPGRYLVLMPHGDYVGVSRKIQSEEERMKIKEIAEKIKPEGMGIIVRTVSEGKSEKDFADDLNYLINLWESIKSKERSGPVPRCLHKDLDLLERTVRDLFTHEIDRFVINDREEFERVSEFAGAVAPELKPRIQYYDKDCDIFDFYNIEPKLMRALSRKVWLKCGGYIVIDRTEALTAIDVNTGKYTGKENLEETVLKANIEAAWEIAKQLRLRDIGGIIVIDFIDMQEPAHQQLVLEELKKALKIDRTRTAVTGMTGLGLIEMTRKKARQALSSFMHVPCSRCQGTGEILSSEAIASKALKAVEISARYAGGRTIGLELHPSAARAVLNIGRRGLELLEKRYGIKIEVVENDMLKYDEFRITEPG